MRGGGVRLVWDSSSFTRRLTPLRLHIQGGGLDMQRLGPAIVPAFTFDRRVAFGHPLLWVGNEDFPRIYRMLLRWWLGLSIAGPSGHADVAFL